MSDNFDIFAGIGQNSAQQTSAPQEDFFNSLANRPAAPSSQPVMQSQKKKNPSGALFEEDDILDQLEDKRPA